MMMCNTRVSVRFQRLSLELDTFRKHQIHIKLHSIHPFAHPFTHPPSQSSLSKGACGNGYHIQHPVLGAEDMRM